MNRFLITRGCFWRRCRWLRTVAIISALVVGRLLPRALVFTSCARRIDRLSLKSGFPCSLAREADRGGLRSMRELLILAIHLVVTIAKPLRPGGARAVAAESLLLKHQLLISNRSRQRAPNVSAFDRFVIGLTTLFVSPQRIPQPWRTHQARNAAQIP